MAGIRYVASSFDGTITIASGAGVVAGDWVLIGQGNDFYQLATMVTPTCATCGVWTDSAGISSNPGNDNAVLGKWWWAPVTTGGAQSIQVTTTPGDGSYVVVYVIQDSAGVYPTPAGLASNTATTAHTIPSVPSIAGGLLLGFVVAGSNGVVDFNANTGTTGLTKDTEYDSPPFSTIAGFSKALVSGGSTGALTVTPSVSRRYAANSIVFLPAATGITIVVGQAAETDTAQPTGRIKVRPVGAVVETGAAQPVTRSRRRAVGAASETSSAQPVTAVHRRLAGQATETGTVMPVGRIHRRATAAATDTGTAQPLGRGRNSTVGQAAETSAAQPVTAPSDTIVPVAAVSETSTAQPAGRQKTKTLGGAAETSVAQPPTRRKMRALLPAGDTSAALSVRCSKPFLIGAAGEIAAAWPLAAARRPLTGAVSETSTAGVLRSPRLVPVGGTIAVDTAMPVIVSGGALGATPGRLTATTIRSRLTPSATPASRRTPSTTRARLDATSTKGTA